MWSVSEHLGTSYGSLVSLINSHVTVYIFTFISYCKHTEFSQNPGSPSTNQIKGIWIKMITDSLGKSAESGKGSKAGKRPPTQNMSG